MSDSDLENEWEDTELIRDLVTSSFYDSDWTEYEYACALKCSVKRFREIKATGRITKRKWDELGEVLRVIYDTSDYDYDDIPF